MRHHNPISINHICPASFLSNCCIAHYLLHGPSIDHREHCSLKLVTRIVDTNPDNKKWPALFKIYIPYIYFTFPNQLEYFTGRKIAKIIFPDHTISIFSYHFPPLCIYKRKINKRAILKEQPLHDQITQYPVLRKLRLKKCNFLSMKKLNAQKMPYLLSCMMRYLGLPFNRNLPLGIIKS